MRTRFGLSLSRLSREKTRLKSEPSARLVAKSPTSDCPFSSRCMRSTATAAFRAREGSNSVAVVEKRSFIPRAPTVQPPALPLSLTPYWGSTMRREKKSLTGVSKKPAFSAKNGRFSGKYTSNRWLTVTCGSSAST